MSKFSQQELESVKQLFDGKRGARSIAKELGIMYSDSSAKDEWLAKNKAYRMANKDKLKEYRKTRIDQDRKNLRDWQNRKCKEDPVFKLRKRVSSSVKAAIKKHGSSKNGSILKHLPYSIKILKEHLESLFEPWMNWGNHGKYDSKTWDDNDPTTWTWQIDHIIPQSDLPYKSMSDENFLKCWALINLRPLSAKQNFIDGVTRARHKAA